MFWNKALWMKAWVGALLLTAAACSNQPEETAAEVAKPAPVAVKTVTVERVETPAVTEVTGTVRARTTSTVAAQMMGVVQEVRAQVGDTVMPGEVLVTIDGKEIEARRGQATAAVNEAKQGIPEAESAIAGARASLELAQSTAKRMQELFGKKSITPQELDETNARVKLAESQLAMAQAKRKQIDDRIRQAEESVAVIDTMRAYTKVVAPFAGVVTERRIEPGALASPGVPLFVIEQATGFRLEAAVEEAKLRDIRVGTRATVVIDALDREVEARVGEIVPVLDSASRSVIVKLDLPAMNGLRSGTFGRARFALGRESRLMIPVEAVQMQGQVASVLVPDSGEARRRLVTLGGEQDGKREVLSGIEAGDVVISPATEALTDGSPIEVRQ